VPFVNGLPRPRRRARRAARARGLLARRRARARVAARRAPHVVVGDAEHSLGRQVAARVAAQEDDRRARRPRRRGAVDPVPVQRPPPPVPAIRGAIRRAQGADAVLQPGAPLAFIARAGWPREHAPPVRRAGAPLADVLGAVGPGKGGFAVGDGGGHGGAGRGWGGGRRRCRVRVARRPPPAPARVQRGRRRACRRARGRRPRVGGFQRPPRERGGQRGARRGARAADRRRHRHARRGTRSGAGVPGRAAADQGGQGGCQGRGGRGGAEAIARALHRRDWRVQRPISRVEQGSENARGVHRARKEGVGAGAAALCRSRPPARGPLLAGRRRSRGSARGRRGGASVRAGCGAGVLPRAPLPRRAAPPAAPAAGGRRVAAASRLTAGRPAPAKSPTFPARPRRRRAARAMRDRKNKIAYFYDSALDGGGGAVERRRRRAPEACHHPPDPNLNPNPNPRRVGRRLLWRQPPHEAAPHHHGAPPRPGVWTAPPHGCVCESGEGEGGKKGWYKKPATPTPPPSLLPAPAQGRPRGTDPVSHRGLCRLPGACGAGRRGG